MNFSALDHVLERGTSAVDWCEGNYRLHPLIAEFSNTVSNFVFLLLSPALLCLSQNYAKHVNRGIYGIWFLFAVVGLASAYFHATLSLFGQLLDELSILWLLAAAFAMWLPRQRYPKLFKGNRVLFQRTVFWSALILTCLAFLQPEINCFVLVSVGVPVFLLLFQEIQRCTDSRVRRLGLRCTFTWVIAMMCWLSDRLFCDAWQEWGMDYFHAVFHVCISFTSIALCSLFAFIDAATEHPEKRPQMRYWPNNKLELGLPYVIVKSAI